MRPAIKRAVCLTIVLACLAATAWAHERKDGGYFTVVDEAGVTVYETGRDIRVGDQMLTEQNKRYEVTAIDGDTARAKLVGTVDLSLYLPQQDSFFAGVLQPRIASAAEQGAKVAIYHTHSDESYVPSDGSESKLGAGGIYQVGAAFAEGLKKNGLTPVLSNAKHDPHDDMAYERSRRTALQLVKNNQPAAIFDIHRDAVPPKVYAGTVDGEKVTKVQLVVGKYGPTGKQIEDYAMKIKAASDQKHPGLVKGIFFAKGGDYNQDLHPRSMLIEVGAHTNDRESAERGVAKFAGVMPTVLGTTGATPANPSGPADVGTAASGASGATKSIGWILAALVGGAVLFLVLSTGSLKEARSKAKQFFTTEFANFLGPLRRKNGKRDDEQK
ncbi:MAG: stage II sporulation protein P [Sporomusaceae bacterium]|nr:stage II sporulation protein P [Sporomusaceae bacterium]